MNQLIIFTLAGSLVAGHTNLRGQAPDTTPVPATTSPAKSSEPRFDLELTAEIPAQEAINLVAEQIGHPLNVVWTGGSESVKLPALRLHQITVRDFFAAITAAGREELKRGRQGYAFEAVEGAGSIYTFNIVTWPGRADEMMDGAPPATLVAADATQSNITYSVDPSTGEAAPGASPNPFVNGVPPGASGSGIWHPSGETRSSQLFDLDVLLNDELTINDLTTAIRTAWTASSQGTEPPADALRFHKETQLLIATGSPQQLGLVQSIVELLRARTQPSADAKDSEIRSLVSQIASLKAESEDARKRWRENEALANDQIAKLRERLAELEIELAKARAQR